MNTVSNRWRRRRKFWWFFVGFVIENMVFECKNVKMFACGALKSLWRLYFFAPAAGYSPSNVRSIILSSNHRLLKWLFKFTCGYRALYTCIKRFLQTGWRAETWFTKFTGGYRALYTCTKRFLQTVVGTWYTAEIYHTWFTGGYGALSTCTKRL